MTDTDRLTNAPGDHRKRTPERALLRALTLAFAEPRSITGGYLAYAVDSSPEDGVEVVIHDVLSEESHHFWVGGLASEDLTSEDPEETDG